MNFTAYAVDAPRSASRLASAFILASVLSACSGGGGNADGNKSGGPEIVSPRGVYQGYITSNATNRTEEVAGVVSASGEGHLRNLETGEQIALQLAQAESGSRDATGTITLYQPTDPRAFGTQRSNGTVSAVIRTQDSISGSYVTNDGEGGTFSLSYDAAASEQGSSLTTLTGAWTQQSTADRYTVNLTVQPDGSFGGTDSKHCVYQGDFSVPDFRFNGYRISGTVQCDAAAFPVEGMAMLTPAQGVAPNRTTEKLSFSIRNAERSYSFDLTKQNSSPVPTQ